MNGVELVDAVGDRLAAFIPSRRIFLHAVPDGDLPAAYLFVYASEGDERASRVVDAANIQAPYLWVTSVSRNKEPMKAAREANWGAAEVRKALRDWRPEGTWRIKPLGYTLPAIRNEALSATTFYAVDQFRVHSYIPPLADDDESGSGS